MRKRNLFFPEIKREYNKYQTPEYQQAHLRFSAKEHGTRLYRLILNKLADLLKPNRSAFKLNQNEVIQFAHTVYNQGLQAIQNRDDKTEGMKFLVNNMMQVAFNLQDPDLMIKLFQYAEQNSCIDTRIANVMCIYARNIWQATPEKNKEQLEYCNHIALAHLSLPNNTTSQASPAFFQAPPAQHSRMRYRHDPYNTTGKVFLRPQ